MSQNLGKCITKKHCSYGHLARTVQKVCKIAENTKYRNIKSGFYGINRCLNLSFSI